MTEPISPFGGTAVAAPPTDMTPPSELAGSADNRRKLIIVGAVVAVLILIAAGYFLFVKGSSSNVPGGAVPQAHAAAPGTTSGNSSTTHRPKTVTLPGVAKKPVGRNPFLALVTQPVGGTSGSGGSTAPSGGGATQGTTQGSTPVTGPVTSPGGSNPKPGRHHHVNAAPVAPLWIELDSVQGTKTATFVVAYSDGTTRTFTKVAAPSGSGQTVFGADFALLSITDRHATVKFGDGTPFDLDPGFRHRHSI